MIINQLPFIYQSSAINTCLLINRYQSAAVCLSIISNQYKITAFLQSCNESSDIQCDYGLLDQGNSLHSRLKLF